MEQRIPVPYSKVEQYVTDLQQQGVNVRWDGWDLLFFKPTPQGYWQRSGAFVDGRWGVQRRIKPGRNGKWQIPRALTRPTSA